MSELTERLERELEEARADERRSQETNDNLRDLLKEKRRRENFKLSSNGFPTNEGDDAA